MTVRIKFDSEKEFETAEDVTAEIVMLNKDIEELEAAIDIINTRIEELTRIRNEKAGIIKKDKVEDVNQEGGA